MRMLVIHGADPNLADKDGDTPLHQIAIDRAPLENRLTSLPPDNPDIRIPDNPTWATMDKLIEPVKDQPERVEAIKKQALLRELEKRIGRLNAYEQLLLSKGANPALKNRQGQTPSDIESRTR